MQRTPCPTLSPGRPRPPGRLRLLGAWALGAVGLTAALGLGLCLRRPGWDAQPKTTQLPSVPAEVFFMDASSIVRVGPGRLVVVRVLGQVDLVPYAHAQAGLPQPVAIGAWRAHLGAPIVFNAGQFDAQRHYLGWLKSRGTWLSKARKPAWMGFLMSQPTASWPDSTVAAPLPWGQLVDAKAVAPSELDALAGRYANVVQSMMLVDDCGQVRVRRSELAACRTVVAQDAAGRLLIIASERAITLYDLAVWLTQSDLRVVRAMNLDGGVESQLAIATPELSLTLLGQYGTESPVIGPRTGGAGAALPMVIAIRPHVLGADPREPPTGL